MKMARYKRLSSLLLILFVVVSVLSSCSKVMDVEMDDSERLLVLNAVPSEGQQLFVNFSYSRFFLDTVVDHLVPNTSMTINVNGVPYSPISRDGCNYFFDYYLQEDDQLSISIDANGHPLSATTCVPRAPQISNVATYIDTSFALRYGVVDFDLTDHANYTNYYHLTIVSHDSGSRYHPYFKIYDTINKENPQVFLTNDLSIVNAEQEAPSAFGGYFFSRLLFNDRKIDGTTHHIRLFVLFTIDTNEVQPFLHQYYLNLEAVSVERLNYLREARRGSNGVLSLTETPEIYTNVQGGYGIFGANARRKLPLTFDSVFSARSSKGVAYAPLSHEEREMLWRYAEKEKMKKK